MAFICDFAGANHRRDDSNPEEIARCSKCSAQAIELGRQKKEDFSNWTEIEPFLLKKTNQRDMMMF
jgi:hypothetical protein